MNIQEMRRISLLRHRILRDLEDFFLDRGYTPVETPLLSPDLIPESAIEFFSCTQQSSFRKNRELYLIPSPEIWMKRLLAEGSGSIFQIGKSFRNSEQQGKFHNPEFTMLEWYLCDGNYKDNIKTVQALLQMLALQPYCSYPAFFQAEIEVLRIEEAFQKWAGFSLEENIERKLLYKQAEKAGYSPDKEEPSESLFNRFMVDKIETSLPQDRATILIDYPRFVRTLSRPIPDSPWTERWELYFGKMELANCFTELTDHKGIQEYYQEEKKEEKIVPHKVAKDLCKGFSNNSPVISGTAMGIDRLIMKLVGSENIEGVLLFPLI